MGTTILNTDNAELLHYIAGKLHITVLGGIKLTGLDRLKVTLKMVAKQNVKNVFRHSLDLYNHIQTGQLIDRAAETLDVPTRPSVKSYCNTSKRLALSGGPGRLSRPAALLVRR